MNKADSAHLLEMLAEFSTAMLTTQSSSLALRSRPMRIAQVTGSGHLWFITNIDSEKVDDLTENPNACASMQDSDRFISISGTARIVREIDKVRELWKSRDAAWFEKGIDDPTVAAVELIPLSADLWDRAGAQGLQFLFEETRAVLGSPGEQPVDERHERIEFDD